MKQKDIILQQSHQLFLKSGIKSLTMDDLARKLGKSKKTIYKYFRNKPHLVLQSMEYFIEEQKAVIRRIQKSTNNSIEELANLNAYTANAFSDVSPNIIFDLQKYYPESWELYLEYKNDFYLKAIKDNLRNGIKEGLYREDIDIDIISVYYTSRVEDVRNPEIFPPDKFTFSSLLVNIFNYHVRGIASPEGKEFLENELQITF